MFDSLSPQRRRVLLATGCVALLLVLTLVVVSVVRRPEAVDPVPQDRLGPVLLVPGYGGTGESLTPLVQALRTAGRDAVVVSAVGDGTGDLRAQAQHLGKMAREARQNKGAPSVDVIGYSAGGVVARLWVRDEGGRSVARRVLSLGSPHHGTSQAALGLQLAGGCPAACEQLVPDSDLLRRLNAGDETPDGPLWATVRSTADRVVTPVDSAALDGAVNVVVQEVCPSSTAAHGDLPSDPVILAALHTLLGVAPPAAPQDVTC